jgi:hypothetical protein
LHETLPWGEVILAMPQRTGKAESTSALILVRFKYLPMNASPARERRSQDRRLFAIRKPEKYYDEVTDSVFESKKQIVQFQIYSGKKF